MNKLVIGKHFKFSVLYIYIYILEELTAAAVTVVANRNLCRRRLLGHGKLRMLLLLPLQLEEKTAIIISAIAKRLFPSNF